MPSFASCGEREGFGEPFRVQGGKAEKPRAPALLHVLGRAVGAEEMLLVVGVARDERREAAGEARMAGKRGVLRPRQLEAGLERRKRQRRGSRAETIEQNRLTERHAR